MCWHYEVFYKKCFDHFDGSAGLEEESIIGLLKDYGVDIIKDDEFRGRLIGFLTKLHDEGVIQPESDLPKPSVEEVKKYFSIVERADGKDVYTEYIKERKKKGLDTFIGE